MITRTFNIGDVVYYNPYKQNKSYKCKIIDIEQQLYYKIQYENGKTEIVYPSKITSTPRFEVVTLNEK